MAEQQGLFLAGGDPRGRPAFHPLFAEFLRTRLDRDTRPGAPRGGRGAVAAALDEVGRGADAVDHWVAAEDWDAVAGAIAREGPGLVRTARRRCAPGSPRFPKTRPPAPSSPCSPAALATGEGRFEEAVELCRAAVDGFERPAALRRLSASPRASRWRTPSSAVGDLAGAAALGDALDDPEAAGDLAARAVGRGRGRGARRARGRSPTPATCTSGRWPTRSQSLRPSGPAFDAYYFDLPAGRLDDALAHAREGVAALERFDPFGRAALRRSASWPRSTRSAARTTRRSRWRRAHASSPSRRARRMGRHRPRRPLRQPPRAGRRRCGRRARARRGGSRVARLGGMGRRHGAGRAGRGAGRRGGGARRGRARAGPGRSLALLRPRALRRAARAHPGAGRRPGPRAGHRGVDDRRAPGRVLDRAPARDPRLAAARRGRRGGRRGGACKPRGGRRATRPVTSCAASGRASSARCGPRSRRERSTRAR